MDPRDARFASRLMFAGPEAGQRLERSRSQVLHGEYSISTGMQIGEPPVVAFLVVAVYVLVFYW